MEKHIDFYFDVSSPYTYVASKLIEEVAQRCNAELHWKPILLGGIFKAVGTMNAPGLTPAKKPYMLKDLKRLAEYYKFTLNMPADFPIRTVLAMRVLSSLTPEKIPPAAHKLFNAYWVDNLDIADPEVVTALVGHDAVEQAGMHDIKKTLFQTTEEAVQRGAFGAPAFFVGDEMFFGHDRMHLLEQYLQN
ncbi:MAG: 2-hydroxychromene-2-carboxylate isomerase [Deltaproteobacteria bacterium]|jgi:2-hydroxychromene-2-carboxylate isomerase|nr:2-hydroxychromene-2-carboxylate isomerase [Deltaproteobacteria bacterium]